MFLYCYYFAGSMKNDDSHFANDDSALCRAWTKKQAIQKFLSLYDHVDDTNVFRVKFNSYGVAVLSDY